VRLVDLLRTAIMALPYDTHRSRIWADLQPDLPLMWGDPQRLEEVLINLLDNALKYSPPAGQVVVKAERMGRYLAVSVLDEGIGIPAEDQAALFNKFQRASNARNLQVPGTGLGLFVCRSIVEAHGGQIMLSSVPGSGTCVNFRLPLAGEEV
jgi:signal transduction histidine kinase